MPWKISRNHTVIGCRSAFSSAVRNAGHKLGRVPTPKTLADLQGLITNRVQEDLHLDYKESSALADKKRGEIAKDVSAFANSDGGALVYGIVEEEHLPVRIDEGVSDREFNREWLENVITSNISPRIDGIQICPIEIAAGRSGYVVATPKSYRGPHQERSSKRYYKRFNFKSEPMEDYEINDVRNRRDVVLPLINIDLEIYHGVIVHVVISNIGEVPAENVSFKLTPDVPELTKKLTPNIITEGCSVFPPGKVYKFFFGSAIEALHKDALHAFDVEVSYYNRRIGQIVTDTYQLDVMDYIHTAIIETDLREQGQKLTEAIGALTKQVGEVKGVMENLSAIAGPTGLTLSRGTIKDLQQLRDGGDRLQKIDAFSCRPEAFREVLGVSMQTAHLLNYFFRFRHTYLGDLDSVTGMTPELVAKLKDRFIIDDEPDPVNADSAEPPGQQR